MKFIIDTAGLRAAAEWAGKHTGSTLPILSAVVVEATADSVTCTATDYDVWAWRTAEAHVVTAGKIAVSGRLLRNVVAALPEGRVDATAEGSHLSLTAGRSFRAKLPTLPAEDHPVRPPVPEPTLHLPESLGRLLAVAAPLAESLEVKTRDQCGCQLELSPAGVLLVARDDYRLFEARLPWPESAGKGATAVLALPAGAVAAAADLAGDGPLCLGLPEGDGTVFAIQAGTSALACRTLGVAMKPWAPFFAMLTTRSLAVDAAELVAEIKRMVPTFDEPEAAKLKILKIAVGGGGLTISTDSSDSEPVEVAHGPEWDADPWQLAVKAPYLLSVLEAADAETVCIDFASPIKSWKVTRPGDSTFAAVVMPIRL